MKLCSASALVAASCAVGGCGSSAGTPPRAAPPEPSGSIVPGETVDQTSRGDSTFVLSEVRRWGRDGRFSSGHLARVDRRTGRLRWRVRVTNSQALAVGSGSVWTTDFWKGTVRRSDIPTGHTIAAIKLSLPAPIAAHDTDFLPGDITFGEGAGWVSTARGYVARIDPSTNRVTDVLKVPDESTGSILAAAGGIWVAENVLGVLRIDPATRRKVFLPIERAGGQRLAVTTLAVRGDKIRAAGLWSDASALTDEHGVATIDPRTAKVVRVTGGNDG